MPWANFGRGCIIFGVIFVDVCVRSICQTAEHVQLSRSAVQLSSITAVQHSSSVVQHSSSAANKRTSSKLQMLS